ncbi:MarR family transcriptional regulator [Amycolatopsis lurida]
MSELVQQLLTSQQRMAARSLRYNESIARKLGVTPTDVKGLGLLVQRPHTPRELADELELTASAVTAVVDRLEHAGFARRERSSTDRRQVTVHAVAEQTQRAVALHISLYERLAEVVSSYDEQQIGTLLDYIEQCTRILADEADRLAT